MTIYLVLLRHTMDDLPLFITGNYVEAVAAARNADWQPTEEIGRVFGLDCTTPVCIDVVTFEDGVPVRLETIKEYDE